MSSVQSSHGIIDPYLQTSGRASILRADFPQPYGNGQLEKTGEEAEGILGVENRSRLVRDNAAAAKKPYRRALDGLFLTAGAARLLRCR